MDPNRDDVEAWKEAPWKQNPWSKLPKWGKWALGIAGVLVVIGVATGDDGGGSGETSTASRSVATNDERTTAQPDQGESPPRAATRSPSKRIRSLMAEEFGDQLSWVKVTKAADGGQIVIAAYDEDETLSVSFTERAIEEEMIDAYRALFDSSNLNVQEAEIDARVQLIDRFGNESYGPGWETRMSADVGKRIRWDQSELLDFEDLWETIYKRPEMD